jgi:hypothetical protein
MRGWIGRIDRRLARKFSIRHAREVFAFLEQAEDRPAGSIS